MSRREVYTRQASKRDEQHEEVRPSPLLLLLLLLLPPPSSSSPPPLLLLLLSFQQKFPAFPKTHSSNQATTSLASDEEGLGPRSEGEGKRGEGGVPRSNWSRRSAGSPGGDDGDVEGNYADSSSRKTKQVEPNLNPKPSTLNHEQHFINPKFHVLLQDRNPKPETKHPALIAKLWRTKPSTRNTLPSNPSTLNSTPSTFNPQNPQPSTLNPQPQTLNPKPAVEAKP